MPASPDQLVVLVTRGRCRVESFSGGAWRAADYRPGVGGLAAGDNANRLRWHSTDDETIETLNMYFPKGLVDATREEYRRTGSPVRNDPLDALLFDDAVIARACIAIVDAAGAGAPELYAQSAAQFIVTHLLSLQSRLPLQTAGRSIGSLPQRRLVSVLDYIVANYAKPLLLDELAREAHVSRFHFVQLFRQQVGVTPHQHVIVLRLEAAARLLLSTDASVQAIAQTCGYATEAHFAKAFGRRYGSTPNAYRRLHQTGTELDVASCAALTAQATSATVAEAARVAVCSVNGPGTCRSLRSGIGVHCLPVKRFCALIVLRARNSPKSAGDLALREPHVSRAVSRSPSAISPGAASASVLFIHLQTKVLKKCRLTS